MRISKRPLLLAMSGLAVVSMLVAALVAFHAGGAHAAAGATYTGARGTTTHISTTSSVPHGVQPSLSAITCTNMTDLPTSGCASSEHDSGVDGTGSGAPHIPNKHRPHSNSAFNGGPKGSAHGHGAPNAPDTGRNGAGSLLANFNGVSDRDNVPQIGGHVTPPDQGLCVGLASALQGAGLPLAVPGDSSVIVEPVNLSWAVYSTDGTLLFGPDNLGDLFSDPFFSGDPSCNYDPATQTFFFTEIGADATQSFFGTGLAVLNAGGYAAYGVDTAEGGACFPDFPQNGFNDDAFYIAINEFCGPDEIFAGSNLYALSKSQLVAHASSVNLVSFQGLSLDGIPVLTLRPAIGGGTTTEYLVNAVSYDANGNSVDVANTLGLWQVDGDQNITSGSGAVTLSGHSIASETYGFPVPAVSTGNGSQFGPRPFVIQEQFLNPDDSRLEQVQFVSGHGPTRLYTSLNTALTIGNDPTVVDGAAWFDIDPKSGKINHQGYVGVAGTYLLYPSIVRSGSGTLMMGFSMTSPTLNPSTGYVLSKNEGNSFSPVQTTGAGSTFHVSFSDILFDEPRWGDYSAIAFDPSNGNVWFADEYIPPADQGGSDFVDNWGTRVWGLSS